MIVNICGIPYEVQEVEHKLDCVMSLGQINYKDQVILLNKDQKEQYKILTLIHEMVHGMLSMIGREDLSGDEQFVNALATAINIGFDVKEVQKDG